jgi:hypothetical protein
MIDIARSLARSAALLTVLGTATISGFQLVIDGYAQAQQVAPGTARIRTVERPGWLTFDAKVAEGDVFRVEGKELMLPPLFKFINYDEKSDPLNLQFLPRGKLKYLSGKGEIINLEKNERVVVSGSPPAPAAAPTSAKQSGGAQPEKKCDNDGILMSNGMHVVQKDPKTGAEVEKVCRDGELIVVTGKKKGNAK